ncbi:MAG: putative glycoside hydrolase [Acidimicrobiia bacterium]|jgi:hypothetical protein
MVRPLHDLPRSPARRRGLGRRRSDDVFAPLRSQTLDLTPRGLSLERSRGRSQRFRPRRQIDLTILLIAASAIGLVAWLGWSFWKSTRVHVELAGLVSGTPFQPEAAAELGIALSIPNSDDRFRASVSLDGVELTEDLEFTGDTLVVEPAELVADELVEGALDEGEHRLRLSVGRLFLPDSTFEWTYVVDSVAPVLEVPSSLDPVPVEEAVTVSGTTEPDAELFLNGEPVEHDDGRFAVDFAHPPTGELRFEAVDPAGNRTTATSGVPVWYPDRVHGVHVSAAAWGDDKLRAGILSLIDRGLVDTVQLDLKDESGVIGYDSEIEEARRIGAVRPELDLAETVAELKERGVRVIGRIVAFRDPIYAQAAWEDGRRDAVLQTPDGEMLSAYGGFTNYLDDEVRAYNRAIALEAVDAGVHDILWDYMRRPEGHPSTMQIPGLAEGATSSEAIVDFLAETHEELRVRGAYQGASVFGIAAASGESIAQDIPAMARVVDYLAPMVYPSHWGPGMYDVESPIHEPYEITKRSLAHFQELTADSGVRYVPWLQDFSLHGVTYGAAEVKAQIDAAAELGLTGFLLWDPLVTYTADALTPLPQD